MRSVNEYEKALLSRLAARLGAVWLNSLIAIEDVAPEDAEWHHIRLHYRDQSWAGGGYTVLADWSARDLDGGLLELLALGDQHGRPYEIEIRRPDLQPIRALPSVEMWNA
jgi:hypothetical protein